MKPCVSWGLLLGTVILVTRPAVALELGGQVVFDDGSPAAGAYVTVASLRASTDADATGTFSLDVPSGAVETILLDVAADRDGITHLASVETSGVDVGTVDLGTIPLEATCEGLLRTNSAPIRNSDFARLGDRLFVVACNSDFRIVDVSDPDAPVVTATLDLPECTQGIVVDEQYAYVGSGYDGVVIIDWTPLAGPEVVSTTPLVSWTINMAWLDPTHVIASTAAGLCVLDVTDPAAPIVHSTDTASLGAATTQGDLIYFAWADGLSILDASDPTDVTTLSYLPTPGYRADDVDVDGDYAYVADYQVGLTIVDVADPYAPFIVTTLEDTSCWNVHVENGRAILAGDNLAGWDVAIVDVSDPLAPRTLSGLRLGGTVSRLDLFGGRGFAGGSDTSQLRTVDLRDPNGWHTVSLTVTRDVLRDIVLDGPVALCAANHDGLQLFDVSDPAAPVLLGAADTPGRARGLVTSGTTAYVADDSQGIQVIDVSDPAAPVLVGSVATPGDADAVDAEGTWVYAVDGDLHIIDASDPAAPVIVETIATAGVVRDVAVQGSYAYVSDQYAGLLVLDVSDPAAAEVVVERPGSLVSVAVMDETMLVDEWFGGTTVYDISTPDDPKALAEVDVSGDYAFNGDEVIAGTTAFVDIVDLSDPRSPAVQRRLQTWGAVSAAVLTDQLVYLASNDGLQIIDRGCAGEDPPPIGVPAVAGPVFALDVVSRNPATAGWRVDAVLPASLDVRVTVFDAAGRRVWGLPVHRYDGGRHTFAWSGRDDRGHGVPAGTYFFCADSPIGTATRKITVLR